MSRRIASVEAEWKSRDQPPWLTEQVYQEQIQPRIARIGVPRLAAALGVSKPEATDIRTGHRLPHPRHWPTLATLVGIQHPGDGLGLRPVIGKPCMV
jgi:hypothetical protein